MKFYIPHQPRPPRRTGPLQPQPRLIIVDYIDRIGPAPTKRDAEEAAKFIENISKLYEVDWEI